MSTNHTANYDLNQWVKSDQVRMEDFNADNVKIDAAIKAVDQRVDGKADASALEAEASARVSADGTINNTLADHTAELTRRGNCQIGMFTYRGNGKYGSDNPTKITFPRRPLFFIVFGEAVHAIGAWAASALWTVNEDCSPVIAGRWSGNTFSFSRFDRADYQMNVSGQTYYVVAFYDMG